jgi:hypothetical protein
MGYDAKPAPGQRLRICAWRGNHAATRDRKKRYNA